MAMRHIATVFVLTLFISIVSCQTTVQMQLEEKKNITVTCNANAVELGNSYRKIRFVQLLYVADTGPTEMAFLQQKDGSSSAISRIGPGLPREWTIGKPEEGDLGEELIDISNRDSMTITATKLNAQCSDSLLVKCIVGYMDEATVTQNEERDYNYTVVGLVTFERMVVFPSNENNEFSENTTVTMTCYAKGPESYEFRWHKRCPSNVQFVAWPNLSEIQAGTNEPDFVNGQPNDCNTHIHSERLEFMAQLDENNCEIRCQFGHVQDAFIADVSYNVTILVVPEEGPTSPPGSSTSASNESLAIGLGVGLTLLVIIIIIILVYVFCFRKRTKDDKYKNDGQDNPDANNLGPNAPPPVFYSKPNKQVKSEKNDARGASIGSEDSYPYEKDIRRKPYFDDENEGLDTESHRLPRSGRRRSNRRSRGDSVDDSDKEYPRHHPYYERQSHGDDSRRDDYYDSQPYASTDISRSEDELSDASGRPKPRPKRRTKYTPKGDEEKELHYADLDIPQRQANNNKCDERNESGFENRDPIHYASIRV